MPLVFSAPAGVRFSLCAGHGAALGCVWCQSFQGSPSSLQEGFAADTAQGPRALSSFHPSSGALELPSSRGCWALGAAEEPSRNESVSDRAGSSPGPVGCVVFWQRLLSRPYPFLHRELSPFKCFDLAEMFQFNISFAMPFSENQYAPLEVLDHA